MKKSFIYFLVIFFLISSSIIYSAKDYYYIDPITYSKGDLRWCKIGGTCTLSNLTITGNYFNVSVIDYNVTGGMYVDNINVLNDTVFEGPVNFKNTTHREDNIKSYYGNDNDASIYHDGTDLIINPEEIGSGRLVLDNSKSDSVIFRIKNTEGSHAIVEDGGDLYIYDYTLGKSLGGFDNGYGTFYVGTQYLAPGLSFLPRPSVQINGDYNGVAGVEMRNVNPGSNADFRFIVYDQTDDAYLAFAMPGANNALGALFGESRSDIATIFSNAEAGGNGRKLVIGTVDAFPLILGTSNTNRVEIESGGNVLLGADNQKLLFGAGNDASIYYDGNDLYIDSSETGSGRTIFNDDIKGNKNIDINGNLTVEGIINHDNVYAEGYYKNLTTPITISIASENTYYNVTNFTQGDTSGVTFEDNGVTIDVSGTYKIAGTISFSGGNSGLYDFGIAVNGIVNQHCGAIRTTSSTAVGNIGFSCIDMFNAGDHLNLQVEDTSASAQDVNIYFMNLNMVRIGR